MNYRLAIAAK